jgi:uncharacterized protein DUF222/HNH endonuclease
MVAVMESSPEFDVVEVVRRAVGIDPPTASETELAWGDEAADLIRGWVDAFQATIQFEQTLPRPLPPLPTDPPDLEPADGADVDEAGAVDRAGADADAAGAGADRDEPLPSLGSQPKPAESSWERERKARRRDLLAELSAFADALRAGRITTGHVDVLATALARVEPAIRMRVLARGDELLASAVASTPERFSARIQRIIARAFDHEGIDRSAAQRARSGLRRGVDEATKMHWLHLDIDPERGHPLFAKLTAEVEAIWHGGHHNGMSGPQVELQALLNLLARPAATAGPDDAEPPTTRQRSSVKKIRGFVLIDIESLLHGEHDRTVCESGSGVHLPVDTVRRLMCIAEVSYGLTINGRIVGHVANAELATPAQRDELRGMYRGCCWPGCTTPFDRTQIHHVIFRSRDGPTDVRWLVPLCGHDHDKVHHEGWKLEIDADRTLTITAPDGTVSVHPFTGLAELDQPRLFDPPAA